MMARWLPQQIPPLNFLGNKGTFCCMPVCYTLVRHTLHNQNRLMLLKRQLFLLHSESSCFLDSHAVSQALAAYRAVYSLGIHTQKTNSSGAMTHSWSNYLCPRLYHIYSVCEGLLKRHLVTESKNVFKSLTWLISKPPAYCINLAINT